MLIASELPFFVRKTARIHPYIHHNRLRFLWVLDFLRKRENCSRTAKFMVGEFIHTLLFFQLNNHSDKIGFITELSFGDGEGDCDTTMVRCLIKLQCWMFRLRQGHKKQSKLKLEVSSGVLEDSPSDVERLQSHYDDMTPLQKRRFGNLSISMFSKCVWGRGGQKYKERASQATNHADDSIYAKRLA
jgi:hypothetical protein